MRYLAKRSSTTHSEKLSGQRQYRISFRGKSIGTLYDNTNNEDYPKPETPFSVSLYDYAGLSPDKAIDMKYSTMADALEAVKHYDKLEHERQAYIVNEARSFIDSLPPVDVTYSEGFSAETVIKAHTINPHEFTGRFMGTYTLGQWMKLLVHNRVKYSGFQLTDVKISNRSDKIIDAPYKWQQNFGVMSVMHLCGWNPIASCGLIEAAA